MESRNFKSDSKSKTEQNGITKRGGYGRGKEGDCSTFLRKINRPIKALDAAAHATPKSKEKRDQWVESLKNK